MVQTKDYDVEFDSFIMNLDRAVTAGTQKAYRSQYLIIRANFDKPLKEVSNKEFINYLDNATTKGGKEISTNTKKNLMNLLVMVKKQVNEKEYRELYELREKLREDVSTEIKEKHENLDTDSMIKYDELVQYLKLQSNVVI
jgi:GTPase involved in cell partitioning and DNA repair